MAVDLQTAWQISFWSNIILLCVIIFIWWRAGGFIWAAFASWWSKTAIAMELTKTGIYRFYSAPIPKEYPQIIQKPNNAGYIEIRRKSKGMDENGNAIYQFSTEHGLTYNTTEISGETYYEPGEYQYAAKNADGRWELKTVDEIKLGNLKDFKRVVKYPVPGTVNPTQFVKYQTNNLNPTVLEGAIKYREMAVARKYQNSFSAFIQTNGVWLIGFLVVAWIIINYMNQNSSAKDLQGQLLACKDQIAYIYQTGGKPIAAAINQTAIKSGAAMVSGGAAPNVP